MTENQKKAHVFLMRLKNYRKNHYKALDKIDSMRYGCLPSAIRYDLDRVHTSPKNTMETLLIASIDAENKLIERHIDYIYDVRFVEDVCRSFTKDEAKVILFYYIMDWKFKDISEELNKTERTIYRLKNAALEKFALHIVV